MKKANECSLPIFGPLLVYQGMCTFQILGGCQGRRTGVGVTTVFSSLIFGRVGDKSFKEWRQRKEGRKGDSNILTFSSYCAG